MRLEATDVRRDAEPEQPGVSERLDQRLGQLPIALGLRCELGGGHGEPTSGVDGIGVGQTPMMTRIDGARSCQANVRWPRSSLSRGGSGTGPIQLRCRDRAAQPRGPGDAKVECDQRRLNQLGEGDVARVVAGQVVP